MMLTNIVCGDKTFLMPATSHSADVFSLPHRRQAGRLQQPAAAVPRAAAAALVLVFRFHQDTSTHTARGINTYSCACVSIYLGGDSSSAVLLALLVLSSQRSSRSGWVRHPQASKQSKGASPASANYQNLLAWCGVAWLYFRAGCLASEQQQEEQQQQEEEQSVGAAQRRALGQGIDIYIYIELPARCRLPPLPPVLRVLVLQEEEEGGRGGPGWATCRPTTAATAPRRLQGRKASPPCPERRPHRRHRRRHQRRRHHPQRRPLATSQRFSAIGGGRSC